MDQIARTLRVKSQNQRIKNYLLETIDIEAVYKGLIPQWEVGDNVECVFAESKHSKKTDNNPSMSIDIEKGVFCHACGYKASSVIGFYEDFHLLSFDRALREVFSEYIKPIVPTKDYKKPARALLNNPLMLRRLYEKKGLDKATVKRWRLGWHQDRLFIPIFNDFEYCINIRKHDIMGRRNKGQAKIFSYATGYGDPILWPLQSLKGKRIYLCEGELKALLMIQYGFSAVTITGGARTWDKAWNEYFKGKEVIILADNDEAGREGAEKKLKSLRKDGVKAWILNLPVKKDKEDISDWFLKYQGTSEDLRRMARDIIKGDKLKTNEGEDPENYLERSDLLMDTLTPKEMLMLERSAIIVDDMFNNGAFFKNRDGSLFYARGSGKVLPIANSSMEYLSFMSTVSPLINTASPAGKFILQHIQNIGFNQSKLVTTGTWSLFHKGSLYLYENKNNIVKLSEDSTIRMPNAINDEGILLEIPYQQMEMKFKGRTKVDDGIKMLWHSFAENLAVSTSDKLLLLCWMLGVFFKDYVQARPLVRLLAKTAWGKSTALKMVSLLIYGDEFLNHSASTLAASYEMSRTHPLLLFDNIETRNMTQSFEDFLLIVATGGLKAKRQKSTDSGIIMDHSNCLLMTNGIEPVNKRELISRTIELPLDLDRFGKQPFHEVKVFNQLTSERSFILSAVLKLLRSEVLPRINSGEVGKIAGAFPAHSKERFNTYMAIMVMILEALWPHLPLEDEGSIDNTIQVWLASQDKLTTEQDSQTNDVIYFLSTFVDRHVLIPELKIQLKEGDDKITFTASTRVLLSDFRILARHLSMRCPWTNERQLGMRLLDAMDILEDVGWRRRKKIVNGHTVYDYSYMKGVRDAKPKKAKRKKKREA